jgi:8-oxo-dGTP pyrophosphatase MutT (NUDIX family)
MLAMDKAPGGIAAAILFVAPDGEVLLLRRSSTEENFAGHWALPGGKADDGETAEQAARREAIEEMGDHPDGKRLLLDERTTPTGMVFHTFKQPVDIKFVPKLNGEHSGYAWASRDMLPEPLHPAVKELLSKKLAGDAALAFDKKTARRYDADNRLHVDASHISKANVCEYLGREIPEWQQLGLVPDRLYRLYRDPEELAGGAATFNNIPILSRHVPVDARDHRPELVIGSTGTDAAFADGYLNNSLVIWSGEAISDIENDIKKELSSCYRYRADMTPGTSPEGEAYDGVMRDIVGNHVALVKEGRAGPDVLVGDAAIPKTTHGEVIMSKVRMQSLKATIAIGALVPFLKPLLAQDAKVDLGPVFAAVKPKTFGNMKGAIVKEVTKLTTGKLAKDAKLGADGTLEGLVELLDVIDGDKTVADEDDDLIDSAGQLTEETMDAENGALQEFLKGKLGEDDYAKACSMMNPGGASDAESDKEKDDDKEKKLTAEDVDKAVAEKTKDMVDKKAMDEAIRKGREEERKLGNDIAAAREDVRPYVGALAGAFDSVEGVYRSALTVLGVENADKIEGVHGLKAVLATHTRQGSKPAPKPTVAQDAAAAKSFAERFPHAAKIKINA